MAQNNGSTQNKPTASASPMGGRGPMGGGPMGGMGMGVEKARDFKGTMRKLIAYLSPYKVSISLVLAFSIASTFFMIVGPKILGQATTKLFEGVVGQIGGTGTGIDFGYIGGIIGLLTVLYFISTVFAYAQGWMMTGVAMKVSYQLRRDIAEKINRMPLGYFDRTNHGEVLSRITNDVDTINQTLNQSLAQIISSATLLVGVIIMMLSISWVMTISSIMIIPLSMGLLVFVMKKSQKYFKEQQDYIGHVNGHVEEMYSSHNVMKAFNGEAQSVARFETYNAKLYNSAWKSQFLTGLLMPMMSFIGNIGYVVVSLIGGWLAVTGAITIGDIQAFIQYSRTFMQPIAQIANISNVLQQTAAASERVFEFLDEPEEIVETVSPINLADVEGGVEFRDVQFGYNPDKLIIRNFSAVVHPGQKIAIVGPTGAGKTTIVKLLMRFYDINSGQILVDGHEIRDFSRHDLRKMFGMVLQDAWLYNDSILENIRYGRLDATDDEVIAAAKAAHVDHFVRTLPDGYKTVLNEEATNVSQGQKQLLTIARAILANPNMLILDEATSSVDTRTEILIQKAMDALMQNRTSFIIAHRLSTIRNADLILVMRDGDIVEQGNHDQLLMSGGAYADMYNSQFDGAPTEEVA